MTSAAEYVHSDRRDVLLHPKRKSQQWLGAMAS